MKIYVETDAIGINSDLTIHSGYDDRHYWSRKESRNPDLTPDKAKEIAKICIIRWQALIDKIDRSKYDEA